MERVFYHILHYLTILFPFELIVSIIRYKYSNPLPYHVFVELVFYSYWIISTKIKSEYQTGFLGPRHRGDSDYLRRMENRGSRPCSPEEVSTVLPFSLTSKCVPKSDEVGPSLHWEGEYNVTDLYQSFGTDCLPWTPLPYDVRILVYRQCFPRLPLFLLERGYHVCNLKTKSFDWCMIWCFFYL